MFLSFTSVFRKLQKWFLLPVCCRVLLTHTYRCKFAKLYCQTMHYITDATHFFKATSIRMMNWRILKASYQRILFINSASLPRVWNEVSLTFPMTFRFIYSSTNSHFSLVCLEKVNRTFMSTFNSLGSLHLKSMKCSWFAAEWICHAHVILTVDNS